MKARLEEIYNSESKSKLKNELGIKNVMQIPKLSKIVLNIGVKEAVADSRILNQVKEIMQDIAGQAVVITKAKKSIAGFKLRQGMPVGIMVTLRGRNMYEFLDRFINLALPLVKDFQGLPLKLDSNGNYNIGIKDWLIFPEVDYDKIDKIRGFNITIHTTTNNDDHARALLKSFNMPFKRS
jgi:large subunit ribosomal protein L5